MFGVSACNSSTTINPDTPIEVIGVLEYTGSVFSPVRSSAPFPFAVRDINGKFIGYLDTTRLLGARPSSLIDKCVVVRGHLVKIDGESVLRADSLRKLR